MVLEAYFTVGKGVLVWGKMAILNVHAVEHGAKALEGLTGKSTVRTATISFGASIRGINSIFRL